MSCITIVPFSRRRFNANGRRRLSRYLGNLVLFHLSINGLKVQILKIHARAMFNHIPSEKFETLEVLLKQYSVILFSGLESSDGLGYSDLHPLASTCQEVVLLLHHQLLGLQLLS